MQSVDSSTALLLQFSSASTVACVSEGRWVCLPSRNQRKNPASGYFLGTVYTSPVQCFVFAMLHPSITRLLWQRVTGLLVRGIERSVPIVPQAVAAMRLSLLLLCCVVVALPLPSCYAVVVCYLTSSSCPVHRKGNEIQ